MALDDGRVLLLAGYAGYRLDAEDGPVGVVDTPLSSGSGTAPDFLVARTGPLLCQRRPVVPVSLVTHVDAAARVVTVRSTDGEIAAPPEHLPVAA